LDSTHGRAEPTIADVMVGGLAALMAREANPSNNDAR
jgi:hypothetical protein